MTDVGESAGAGWNVEDGMDVAELRRELRRAWNAHYALMQALSELPAVPPLNVLNALADAKTSPSDWERGKQLQRQHGLGTIPPVSEYERGAGLWDILRRALRIARHEPTGSTIIGGQAFTLSAWSGDIFDWRDQADLRKEVRRSVQGPIERALKDWRSRGFQLGQGREAAEEAADAVVEYLLRGECEPARDSPASAVGQQADAP